MTFLVRVWMVTIIVSAVSQTFTQLSSYLGDDISTDSEVVTVKGVGEDD